MAAFPWHSHRINVLTVERPKPVLRGMLRRNGYHHWCDHGTFGDEMWLHEKMRERTQVRGKLSRIQACGPEQVSRCEQIADATLRCNGMAADLAECTSLQRQHTVEPHVSWGTLPPKLWRRWDALYCNDYLLKKKSARPPS